MNRLPTRVAGTLACALILAAATATAADAQTAPPATLRVVHGIPGRDVAPNLDPQLPVDVLVNDSLCVLRNFTFRSVSPPFSLPAGSYSVKVSLANSVTPCGNTPVISQTVTLTAGEEAAAVAALSLNGNPVLDAFALDLSPVPAGQGRVIVAHAADAPPVAVSVDGKRAIRRLLPGTEAAALLPAGDYAVAVFPNGQATPVVGPLPFAVDSRVVSVAFAVGSAASGSITLVVATIPDVF